MSNMSHRVLKIEESKQHKRSYTPAINDNRFYANLTEKLKHLENENRSLVIKLDYAREEIESTRRKWQIILILVCLSCFAGHLCFGSTMTERVVTSDPTSDLGSAY